MRFAYVGWVGHGNLGDDAIGDAVLGSLRPDEVVYASHSVRGLRESLLQDARGASHRHLLLGGGTAIGRRNWRGILTAAGAIQARRAPWFMIGAGVEDPEFGGRNSFSGNGELARWRRMLRRFDRVTVRGPRSAQLLAEVGVEARIVGDPALLLAPDSTAVRGGDIAVCLGYGDDLWGHGQERVLEAVSGMARDRVRGGAAVRLLVMNDDDTAAAQHVRTEVTGALGENAPVTIHRTHTVPQFFDALHGCDALVSQRLHGAVLAAAASVPVVALEYQPKCGDFMASIEQDDVCLRCDTVSSGGLADALDELDIHHTERRERIDHSVRRYRDALHAELDRIRAVTGGTRETGDRAPETSTGGVIHRARPEPADSGH